MAEEFVGREDEVGGVWSLGYDNGESVLIVSDMPNGRTSILRYLEARFVAAGRRAYFIDAGKLSPEVTADELMQRIHDRTGIDPARSYGGRQTGNAPIVLIDDVHVLLGYKHLQRSAFFGVLRSHTQIGSLGFVGTSQASLLTLSRWLSGANRGSPAFNAIREVRLEVLNGRDTDRALGLAGDAFSATDREFIVRCSGAQPKLLNLLGSALFTIGQTHPDMPAHARRRQGLHVSRPEIGNVLHAIWDPLALDERWCLVNISAGMRCAEEVPSIDPREPQILTPSHEGARLAALVRCFHQLTRETLVQVVREELGSHAAAELPGAVVSDTTMFGETAEFLRRCGQVGPVLRNLARRDDVPHEELRRLMQLWDAYAPMEAVSEPALDRLVERGLVRPSLTPPYWEIRPALLHWWLLDHIRVPRLIVDLIHRDGERHEPIDCRTIHEFVARRAESFRPGALPLIEEAVQ